MSEKLEAGNAAVSGHHPQIAQILADASIEGTNLC
jgi:hypothetical protein